MVESLSIYHGKFAAIKWCHSNQFENTQKILWLRVFFIANRLILKPNVIFFFFHKSAEKICGKCFVQKSYLFGHFAVRAVRFRENNNFIFGNCLGHKLSCHCHVSWTSKCYNISHSKWKHEFSIKQISTIANKKLKTLN